MSFLYALVRRDIASRLHERWALVMWIAIPVVLGGMIASLFVGRDGPAPVAHLLLVDQDQSLISGLLAGALGQGPLADLVRLEPLSDADVARQRMDAGAASAWLTIPAGFGQAVLANEPVTLALVTNPAQRILPGIVEEALRLLVEAVFYAQQVFKSEIEQIRTLVEDSGSAGPGDTAVAQISVTVNRTINSLQDYLIPPRLTLSVQTDTVVDADSESSPSYLVLLFPGIVLMALMFAAQSSSDDFWKEREAGTLRRLAVAPYSLTVLVVGKALAVAVLLAGVGGIVLTLGFFALDLPWTRWVFSVVWLSAGGVLLFALMSALALTAPSRRAASIFTSVLLFPLLIVGGSFFPLESLPSALASVGAWTPNGWIGGQLKEYLLGRSSALGLASAVALSLPITIALLGFCRLRLRAFAR